MSKIIKELVQHRRPKRASVTKLLNKLTGNLEGLTSPTRIEYIEHFSNAQEELEQLNNDILQQMYSQELEEEDIEAEIEGAADYQVKIITMIANLKATLTVPVSPVSPETRSALKLPQVPLPEFGNRIGEDLSNFFINFENIINKHELTEYEKYLYLTKQVKNEPLIIIKSLELAEQNYSAAKELLTKAFACKTTQKYNAIKRLSKLKLDPQDDVYCFISNMRQTVESFKILEIDTEMVLQFFIWQGFNDELKHQFISITNNNKPTLAEIQEHIYSAAERFTAVRNKVKADNQHKDPYSYTNSSAAMVKSRKNKKRSFFCTLCSKDENNTSHETANCSRYPGVEQKVQRIQELGGCLRCGLCNHNVKTCKFNFKKSCGLCSGQHFDYLCKNSLKGKLSAGSVFVGTIYDEDYGADCVIPTFSKRLENGSIIRGMRDSGCQANFVTNKVARKLNLTVVMKDCLITINGFTGSEQIKTNVVELKLLEDKPPIRAICIPNIRTKLSIKGLTEVVQAFQRKGFRMADEFLSKTGDVISNLDVVLGNKDAHLIPQKEVLFGGFNKSTYSETPDGIMLIGSVGKYLKNLKHLQEKATRSRKKKKQENPIIQGIKDSISSTPSALPIECLNVCHEISVDPSGHVDPKILDEAVANLTKDYATKHDLEEHTENEMNEVDCKLNEFALENLERDNDGRLVVPLLWNNRVCHLLGKNYNLSKSVLQSNVNRLRKDPVKLKLYDEVLKSHLSDGIIEKIDDVDSYLGEHPQSTFIPHMGVFKMENESTKCRIVLLSNLVNKTKEPSSISHNQAMLSGANLNNKITTAVTKLRFDKYLIAFDLVKAFLNVGIREIDQDKLIIMWYNNVLKNDFKLVAYKYKRLPFGLRPSPTLLMICLYQILVIDAGDDTAELRRIKRIIYDLSYMDNLAYSTNDLTDLQNVYSMLNDLFAQYQFKLQQWVTNSSVLQGKLVQVERPTEEPKVEKILGLLYDTIKDAMSTEPLKLDKNADTKRKMLSSIASNYDALQINAPLLNRARLHMHKLQCADIEWDDRLSDDDQKHWRNICNQVNNKPSLTINRCMGSRNSHYELIGFTDASKFMYGTVVYLVDENSKISFVKSNSRIVSKQISGKSIPSLELNALNYGVKVLMDVYTELAGPNTVNQIAINKLRIYCDSQVALAWLNSYTNKLEKMRMKTPFLVNRLESICNLCETFPISFHFVEGHENPADYLTRPVSYNLLNDTCYLTGPDFLRFNHKDEVDVNSSFTVPNPIATNGYRSEQIECNTSTVERKTERCHLLSPSKYSNFRRLVRVLTLVSKFIYKLKCKIITKSGKDTTNIIKPNYTSSFNFLIKRDQEIEFPELISYFESRAKNVIDMPDLVKQLNIFQDQDGCLKVRSKFKQWKANPRKEFPMLLSPKSSLTSLIISDLHLRLKHSGYYSLISQLRKEFFIPKIYITVQKIVKKCTFCKRLNERTVKLNQSNYREFRENPPQIPFRYVFIDYFGPYSVKIQNSTTKVWVLCITCLWTRSINLKVAYDMTTGEFLRTLQLHVFDHGIPQKIVSDLGSNLVAGSNVIMDLLKDPESQTFFEQYQMKVIEFQQYYKGNSSLGSLVESCVKLSKRLISGCIGNSRLDHIEFNFIIAQAVHLVNKRPIAFKSHSRDSSNQQEVPEAITPEILLRGFDIPSLDLIPSPPLDDIDKDWNHEDNLDNIKFISKKLSKVRIKLRNIYNDEFLSTLVSQAVSQKDKFKPVLHKTINVNDIVLLKEEHVKAMKYPMGVIVEAFLNDLGEVTSVQIRKANGEIVKRHVSSIIPYIAVENESEEKSIKPVQTFNERPVRKAAVSCKEKTLQLKRF